VAEKRPHARSSKAENSAISAFVGEQYAKMVKTLLLDTAPRDRRPEEFKLVTGAGSRRRFFSGVPFRIRLAQWVDVLEGAQSEQTSMDGSLNV
jgi:hypothetical protein